jgi:excinuclease ABC subunit A
MGRMLYILDEPTMGPAFEDVAALLCVLQRMVDAGNTVVILEHHVDVIKNADYIIELGPGGGDRGGSAVATGAPEEVARERSSATEQCSAGVLQKGIECVLPS